MTPLSGCQILYIAAIQVRSRNPLPEFNRCRERECKGFGLSNHELKSICIGKNYAKIGKKFANCCNLLVLWPGYARLVICLICKKFLPPMYFTVRYLSNLNTTITHSIAVKKSRSHITLRNLK